MPGTCTRFRTGLLASLCALLGFAPPAPGADTGSAFAPPVPDPKGFDWIKLESGEWLKGDLLRMRDHKLEFDSDKLDEVDFDWEDVHEVHTSRSHTYVFQRRVALTGVAVVRLDTVTIQTESGVIELPRSELIGIVQGTPRELELWSGEASLGLGVRSGNTNEVDLSGDAEIARESAFTRLSASYTGSVSVVNGVTNANSHRVEAQDEIFLTRRVYVVPAYFEYFRDPLQNIDHRLTPAALLGYQILDEARAEWDVALGGAYQWTRFESAQVGASADGTAALVFQTSAEVDVTKDLEWDTGYKLQLTLPDPDQTNHHLQSKLSYDLFWNIDLDVTFVWDRNEGPEPDSQGVVPKKNDYRLTVGFGLDF